MAESVGSGERRELVVVASGRWKRLAAFVAYCDVTLMPPAAPNRLRRSRNERNQNQAVAQLSGRVLGVEAVAARRPQAL